MEAIANIHLLFTNKILKKKRMKKQQMCSDKSTLLLPIDLAFEIVSSLEATDVCSLGSCSKVWKQICDSDSLWESFCKQRWPSLFIDQFDPLNNNKRWKEIYMKKHTEMAEKMASYRKCLITASECTVDIDDYLKVIQDMKTMEFGFNDVKMFFFKSNQSKNHHVLLDLIGLHYCIKHLNLQVEDVLEAITDSNIQEKKVCIQWRRKGGWMHRFPLPDQLHRQCLTLKEIITKEGNNEPLDILDRGLNAVVVQVQISSYIPECSSVEGEGCEFTYVLPYWESTPQIQA